MRLYLSTREVTCRKINSFCPSPGYARHPSRSCLCIVSSLCRTTKFANWRRSHCVYSNRPGGHAARDLRIPARGESCSRSLCHQPDGEEGSRRRRRNPLLQNIRCNCRGARWANFARGDDKRGVPHHDLSRPGPHTGSINPASGSDAEQLPLTIDVPDITLRGAFVMSLDGLGRPTGTAGGGGPVTTIAASPGLVSIKTGNALDKYAEPLIVVERASRWAARRRCCHRRIRAAVGQRG